MTALTPSHLDAFAITIWTSAAAFLPRLAAAAALLVFGALAARWACQVARKIAERSGRLDPTLEPVLASLVRYAVLILVGVAALSALGVQTASVLTVLGAAGLAVGLALQGTLSNIAAGVMLLWLRPFKVGDHVEVISGNPIGGTVKEIGLFAVLVEGDDGARLFAPNSTIWNFALRNRGGFGARPISLSLELPREADHREGQGRARRDGRRRRPRSEDAGADNLRRSPGQRRLLDRLPSMDDPQLRCRGRAQPSCADEAALRRRRYRASSSGGAGFRPRREIGAARRQVTLERERPFRRAERSCND